jgi:hypothetical protein
VAALFRVARKVAPTIIFIDEVAVSLLFTIHQCMHDCFALVAACGIVAVHCISGPLRKNSIKQIEVKSNSLVQ